MTDPEEHTSLGDSDDVPIKPSSWGPSDSFNSLLPVVAFVALNSFRGLKWAIVGTTVASLYAMYNRHRRGIGVGLFIPLVAATLVVRAIIGVATNSDDVYFGTGIAVKFLVVLALVISVVMSRNAVAHLAPFAIPIPAATLSHDLYRTTTAGLTLIWAVYLALSGAFDIWLLSASSTNGFVIIRFLVSWPVSTATMIGALAWANRRLKGIPGFPGLFTLLETRMAAISGIDPPNS